MSQTLFKALDVEFLFVKSKQCTMCKVIINDALSMIITNLHRKQHYREKC